MLKFLNNIKISVRLNLVLGSVIVVIFLLLGTYIINLERNKSEQEANERLYEQVEDLSNALITEVSLNQERVNLGMEYTKECFKNIGNIIEDTKESKVFDALNAMTNEKIRVKVPTWFHGEFNLDHSTDFVDQIGEKTGGVATILQKIPEGFLRISTNVMNNEGTRVTGTYLPNETPVAKAINAGKEYYGRAYVVNDWYITAYIPILINNSIEGMLFFGLPEKNLGNLKSLFKSKQYYESGYPYMVSSGGELLIHPNAEGTNINSNGFFKDMAAFTDNNVHDIEYEWEGKSKMQYFKYIKQVDSYIAITAYTNEIYASLYKLIYIIIFTIIFSIVVFIIINSFISKNISSALNKGVAFANALATGNLNYSLDINQKDEVGMLASALQNMAKKLQEIVISVVSGSESITSASLQISHTSESMSQGANEQASSVEEVSSTMEEIAANIQQNTENAIQTEKISNLAQSGIEAIGIQGKELIEANRIISEKITIVQDIAFQTNILALNAAVEAARAGDHGKGFAVVASEVRKLAETSKAAAEEIVSLTGNNLQIAENTAQKIEEILPEVRKTAQLVQEISAAGMEQNNGALQINNAIQQLNDVSQQNAAASEELATSAEEMNGQAEQLKEIISFFKTNENTL